jgi:hypothetical protein
MTSSQTIQDATVAELEQLSDPARDVLVEAWAVAHWAHPLLPLDRVPTEATEPCSNDALHGKGSCNGPTGDPLCLACQIKWIEENTVAGSTYSIDVYA